MGYQIGIDVGGTFTDFVLVRPDGTFDLTKTATTPYDESKGVVAGLGDMAAAEGLSLADLLHATDAIVHGTTTADNTLIQMNGAATGLITTEGHRDEIEIRRGWREDIWDIHLGPPEPIARRRHRIGVPGRLDHKGNVLVPLDEEAARAAARRLRAMGIDSIAVTLLFSFVDPTWEARVGEIIAEEFPDALVSLSHEVAPSAPEFERTSTTLVNAYIGPRVVEYLQRLEEELEKAGYAHQLLVMLSNGGIATVEAVCHRPITVLASGPAGGVVGAADTGRTAGSTDFISVDMGGTSYDVCLARGGQPDVKSFWNWIHRYLITIPVVDVLSIGAGGGSIAEVKAGGLRIGPESAGADPGPICYGKGGTKVTVTDANVYLGYLNPEAICGGRFALSAERVADSINDQIAGPLGISVTEAAAGIFRLTNAQMNQAIQRVSSERGHDPRRFDLIAFGGNGGVHAPAQALDLGFPRVLVPKAAPALSALGILLADHVVDRAKGCVSQVERLDLGLANSILAEMRLEAEKELANANVAHHQIGHTATAACRYPGQTFTLDVPVHLDEDTFTEKSRSALVADFHRLHEELHTFATRDEPVIIVELKLRATGETPRPRIAPLPAADTSVSDAEKGRRKAYFDGDFVDVAVYDGTKLLPDHEIAGPAIVEETFTTVVLQPSQTAVVDAFGNYVITGGAA
ncbi:MAG: hydantoinase/oxoprolinase family protein [Acidimicrobiia bacterium]|nr:hydantoinase/oxoprolinase family protein [Acidimicrobiia bacterium]